MGYVSRMKRMKRMKEDKCPTCGFRHGMKDKCRISKDGYVHPDNLMKPIYDRFGHIVRYDKSRKMKR